jgi:anthranilate phosphoribosyltransferase
MKQYLQFILKGEHLNREEAKELILNMTSGNKDPRILAAILTAYHFNPPNLKEIEGFRDGLLDRATRVNLSEYRGMDLCGTGGDGKNTFNISTLSSFIVASCGIPVTKHGNYSASSVCGSSNVLEYLSYQFKTSEDALKKELDKNGICFLHAPLFHPCLKEIAPIRKTLSFKTFFNLLGPLVNPSIPKIQSTGVFNLEVQRQYHYLLQQSHDRHSIIHSIDGYDEVSLTGSFKIVSSEGEFVYHPSDFGLSVLNAKELAGGETIKESAQIFTRVLQGKGNASQNQVVAINAAIAMNCYNPEKDIQSHFEDALECLLSGKGYQKLRNTIYT